MAAVVRVGAVIAKLIGRRNFRSPLIAVVVAGVLCDKVGMHPPSQLPQPATLPPSLATRPLNARNLENIFFESSGAAAGPCWLLYLTNPRPRAPL